MANRGSVIVVFGITGDLSKRKLLPALYHLLSHDELPIDTKIIGISRKPLTVDELLSTVELCVLEADKICDPVGLARVRASLQTHQLDPETAEDFDQLKILLDQLDEGGTRERLFYMSVPAAAYAPIVQNLALSGLNDDQGRILLEKPFGYDSNSASELLTLVDQNFREEQIYRIDHYLTKETAQNLLAFRLHNPIFTPIWNASNIRRVHILASETLGIEGRVDFYEQTGALRDLIQSHLMQLLCITLMDLPADMSSEAIHLSKQHFMEQLRPADPAEATRGQYATYRTEVDNPHSSVETYAKIHLTHAAERWHGTDIVLETGKALASKTTEITVEFKTPHEPRRNNLTFRIQPNEGIGLDLVVKKPGFENHMQHAVLDFTYAETFTHQQTVDAYERVLTDAIRGDQSLFASDREVMASWRVLDPVLEAWASNDSGLHFYEQGTGGPAETS